MRTFYIFKINQDYYNLTKNIPYDLYRALLNIKLSTENSLPYIKNEYDNMVDRINKKELSSLIYEKMNSEDGYNIFNNIHTFNNFYTDEASRLIINNSFMILKSNVVRSSFVKYLADLNNLFFVDFSRGDYFFLSNLIKL